LSVTKGRKEASEQATHLFLHRKVHRKERKESKEPRKPTWKRSESRIAGVTPLG
jgi:hypothetical protein